MMQQKLAGCVVGSSCSSTMAKAWKQMDKTEIGGWNEDKNSIEEGTHTPRKKHISSSIL